MEAGGGYRTVDSFAGWELRDHVGRRVGRVLRVFVDGSGWVAHAEVALGPFGTRIVLLPVAGVGVDRGNRAISLLGKGRRRSDPK